MKPGRCYDHALVTLFQTDFKRCLGVVLCHGYPTLQKPDGDIPAGTVYGHAWIEASLEEAPDVVMCFNQVPDRVLPQDVYYAAGNIEDRYVRRYTLEEAAKAMEEHGTTGPWVTRDEMPPGTVFAD